MKLGILLFLAGVAIVFYLLNFKFEKKVLKNIALVLSVLLALYGLILTVQPEENKYVKFTKSTIHKDKNITTK